MKIKSNNQAAEALQEGFAGIDGVDSDIELFDVSESLLENTGSFGGMTIGIWHPDIYP